MSKHNEEYYGPDCMYHNFVRPLERLFTVDMPLSKQLAQALKYKDATDDLGHFVMKLVWIRSSKMLITLLLAKLWMNLRGRLL